MEQVRLAVPEILELNGKVYEDVYLDFSNGIMKQAGIDHHF
jgi:hypothetical protein